LIDFEAFGRSRGDPKLTTSLISFYKTTQAAYFVEASTFLQPVFLQGSCDL